VTGCKGVTIPDDVLTRLPALPLSQVEHRVRDGDILLCSANDLGSRLISWSTRSQWSHVALAYRWPSLGRIMAFECVHTIGVRAVALSQFVTRTSSGVTPYPGKILLARHEDFAARKRTGKVDAMRRLGDFAVDRFGDPFASGEILKIAARIVLARAGIHTPSQLAPRDEFICSEYVARCLEKVGIDIPWEGAGFIAPADFARDPKMHAVARIQTR
jgi:hypothetical protein